MLLVNNPGSWSEIYAPLQHAPWHGWTVADAIFPFFLWIVGVSLTLSRTRRAGSGESAGEQWGHAVRRAAIIFGLGLMLAAFPFGLLPAHEFSFATLRIPGVLQRIAVCYLLAALVQERMGVRGQAAWAVGLLAGYWLLLVAVPVPGHGAGVLTPAGNLAGWIDGRLLAGHTWRGAPAPGFDPEGLLSTLPALASTLLGGLAGWILLAPGTASHRVGRLLAAGAGLLLAGAIMSRWLPINKSLWTSSYAVFMAGLATLVLAGLHWLVDGRGFRRWATLFIACGRNALLIFVLAGLLGRLVVLIRWPGGNGQEVVLKTWLFRHLFAPLAEPTAASLLYALAFVAVHLAIAWVLWRRRWWVKI